MASQVELKLTDPARSNYLDSPAVDNRSYEAVMVRLLISYGEQVSLVSWSLLVLGQDFRS